MASELNVVPSLRALAFNRLAKRYRKFENKGREDQLVLMLSKLPVTLIPEFMRRKAALDAIEAADDVKEVSGIVAISSLLSHRCYLIVAISSLVLV